MWGFDAAVPQINPSWYSVSCDASNVKDLVSFSFDTREDLMLCDFVKQQWFSVTAMWGIQRLSPLTNQTLNRDLFSSRDDLTHLVGFIARRWYPVFFIGAVLCLDVRVQGPSTRTPGGSGKLLLSAGIHGEADCADGQMNEPHVIDLAVPRRFGKKKKQLDEAACYVRGETSSDRLFL